MSNPNYDGMREFRYTRVHLIDKRAIDYGTARFRDRTAFLEALNNWNTDIMAGVNLRWHYYEDRRSEREKKSA